MFSKSVLCSVEHADAALSSCHIPNVGFNVEHVLAWISPLQRSPPAQSKLGEVLGQVTRKLWGSESPTVAGVRVGLWT